MEKRYIPLEHESIPAGELAVHRGAAVEASDGYVGRVDEFLVDPENEHITHLVMREGHLWEQKEVTIPASAIARVEEDAVYLKLNKAGIEALPAVHTGPRKMP
jgi:sporulation protein YlmC with PRC-barrel domain